MNSLSRLTMRMIVHDSVWSAVLPQKTPCLFRMATKSSLQGSAAAEFHVYIQDDNHDKENFSLYILTWKEGATSCSHDFACVTAIELLSRDHRKLP